MARQFCRLQSLGAQHGPTGSLPTSIHTLPVSTPLLADAWHQALLTYPGREWTSHLVTGIREGVRIGLLAHPNCQSIVGNSPSAAAHCEVVSSFLASQVEDSSCSNVVTSRMAVISKSTPGKFRVIVDLSAPAHNSVNDNIHRDLTHVAYSSINDAALLMHHLGKHALMAKIDIQDAYRLIPIHPMDRSFLGVTWQGGVYVDCQLPFGLASAPVVFSAFTEALEWILRSRGVRNLIHYLADFLLFGPPSSFECLQALHSTLTTCQELGIPLALHKVEGPTTRLVFLGIGLDSSQMALSLPDDKLLRLSWAPATVAHTFSHACLPVTSEKATLFVAFLGTQGLSLSTIESYLSALRHMRLTLAPCDPCPSLHSPQMALLRGIRRSQAQSGLRLVRLPITPTLMRDIKSTLARHADSYDSILLWAACCIVFLAFSGAGSSWFQTQLLLIRILTCH